MFLLPNSHGTSSSGIYQLPLYITATSLWTGDGTSAQVIGSINFCPSIMSFCLIPSLNSERAYPSDASSFELSLVVMVVVNLASCLVFLCLGYKHAATRSEIISAFSTSGMAALPRGGISRSLQPIADPASKPQSQIALAAAAFWHHCFLFSRLVVVGS